MAEGRPEAGPRTGESRQPLARVVLAALLVVAVVAGLRGEVRPLSFRSLPRSHDAAVGLALEAVLAVLMAALVIRRRRAPDAALLVLRLRGLIGAALAIGLAGIPVLLLLANLPKPHGQRHPNPFQRPGHGRQPPLKAGSPLHLPIGGILTALLVIAIVAAIVICVIVLRRWTGYAAKAVLEPEDDDEEKLREAVESGRAALRELDDARAAIIACYLAMERSLASAGAARAVAETPDELLARAAGAGLVRGEAAGRLTALFYEARFSSHPLPASSKAEAQWALSELAASLGTPAAAGPAAAGKAAP
jgi:Domain of unknown function (DUF4129)